MDRPKITYSDGGQTMNISNPDLISRLRKYASASKGKAFTIPKEGQATGRKPATSQRQASNTQRSTSQPQSQPRQAVSSWQQPQRQQQPVVPSGYYPQPRPRASNEYAPRPQPPQAPVQKGYAPPSSPDAMGMNAGLQVAAPGNRYAPPAGGMLDNTVQGAYGVGQALGQFVNNPWGGWR